MTFDSDFVFELEEIKCEDRLFISNWGENLYHIRLKFNGEDGKITYVIK